MFALSVYATQALHGIVSGMLLFLVASGLTLVFGMMGILNIAHAGFYMLGAYLAYSTVHKLGRYRLKAKLKAPRRSHPKKSPQMSHSSRPRFPPSSV